MVLEKAGTQPLGTCIDSRQATVAELVSLRPILEVCNRDTGYNGGGRRRVPWWRQKASRKQLSYTTKEILVVARERRWESGRRGGGVGGDRDAEESEDEAGSDRYRYAGTETGDAVDKVCTYTDGQRTYTDGQISKPATLDRLDSV